MIWATDFDRDKIKKLVFSPMVTMVSNSWDFSQREVTFKKFIGYYVVLDLPLCNTMV